VTRCGRVGERRGQRRRARAQRRAHREERVQTRRELSQLDHALLLFLTGRLEEGGGAGL